MVKPDIVFFGEAVREMDEASRVAGRADLFLVIGSSLTVYPAALLPQHACGQVVVVNQGPVEMASSQWLRVDEAADPFFARVAAALDLARLPRVIVRRRRIACAQTVSSMFALDTASSAGEGISSQFHALESRSDGVTVLWRCHRVSSGEDGEMPPDVRCS